MFNIQTDILDRCGVILKLIDLMQESSDDITVMASRADKIKELKTSIANLMVKFEELGSALNQQEELEKVYTVIRLFESDIPKIKEITDGKKYALPESVGNISLEKVRNNVALLETRLENCISEIQSNLDMLNGVIKEKVPVLSGIMGKLHGEETITEMHKAEMSENAMTIMMQINDSCNKVVTNLDNVTTLTIGAITYICKYIEKLSQHERYSQLAEPFQIIKMKQNKVKEVLIA